MDVARFFGRSSEQKAARYLEKKGFDVVTTNYRSRFGEVDIVASRDETLVFVEVRARKLGAQVSPLESVDAGKKRRLIRTALHYLAELPSEDWFVRFDVIGIDSTGTITHIEDAFPIEDPRC